MNATVTAYDAHLLVGNVPRDHIDALTEMHGGGWSGGFYRVPLTFPLLIRLSEILPRAHWSTEAVEMMLVHQGIATVLAGLAGNATGSSIRSDGGTLSDVQQQGATWLQMADDAILADEMGSGKTVQACVAANRTAEIADPGFRMLVVCPASIVHQWVEHIDDWCPHIAAHVMDGPIGQRRQAVLDAEATFGASALIVSWSNLTRHSRLRHWAGVERTEVQREAKELNGIQFDLVIADEAHRAKNPKSNQTRALWALDSRRRWAMTGTPVANRPEDFWALLHFLDPLSWPSKQRFVDEFCATRITPWGTVEVTGFDPRRLARLGRFVSPYYRRRTMAEAIGRTIDKVRQTRRVELPKSHREQYDTLDDEWRLVYGDDEIWSSNAAVATTRLCQAACAALVIDGDAVEMRGPSPKVAEFGRLLEDLGDEQVVAFSMSRKLLTLVEHKLVRMGISYVTVAGDVASKDRALRVERFRSGEARVFLATVQAAGEGLDLSCARVVCHLSKSWSSAMTTQAEDRVRRWTQDADSVLIVDIVATNTIESRIAAVLARKGRMLGDITPKELAE